MRRIPELSPRRRWSRGHVWSEARLQEARAEALELAYRAGLLR